MKFLIQKQKIFLEKQSSVPKPTTTSWSFEDDLLEELEELEDEEEFDEEEEEEEEEEEDEQMKVILSFSLKSSLF